MEILGGLLGLISVTGLCVAGVMLIVRVLFKKGWEYQKIKKVAKFSFALFIVVGILAAVTGDTFTNGPKSDKQSSVNQTVNKKEGESKKDAGQKEVEKKPAEEKQTEKQSPSSKKVIPGLEASDIKLNLKRWGLEFSGPEPGVELFRDEGKVVDPDTGVELICVIWEYSPTEIAWIDFIVDSSRVVGLIDVNTINGVSRGYLGFCATAPYDGADQVKAKQWVESNCTTLTAGNPKTITIGPVSYELFGTEYIRTLRLKPAQ